MHGHLGLTVALARNEAYAEARAIGCSQADAWKRAEGVAERMRREHAGSRLRRRDSPADRNGQGKPPRSPPTIPKTRPAPNGHDSANASPIRWRLRSSHLRGFPSRIRRWLLELHGTLRRLPTDMVSHATRAPRRRLDLVTVGNDDES